MIPKCIEFLRRQRRRDRASTDGPPLTTTNWSPPINIPHPAFDTNATWLGYVHEDKVGLPKWLPEEKFHPADSYMSISKSVWRNFTRQEVLRYARPTTQCARRQISCLGWC